MRVVWIEGHDAACPNCKNSVDISLRTLRGERSLRDVAVAAGIDTAHLSRVERGQKSMSVAALVRVLRALEREDLASFLEHVTAVA